MTDVESGPDDAPPAGQPVSGRRRWATIAALAAVVAATAWLGWWLRHPDDLGWGGYGFGTTRAPGEALWASVSDPALRTADRRVITIDEIEPADLRVPPRTRVDYFVCSLDPDELGPRTSFGTGSGDDVRRACRELRTARGSTMDLVEDPRQQVLVRIAPTRPGVVRMAGHRVEFREGWQSGVSRVGPELRVRVRP